MNKIIEDIIQKRKGHYVHAIEINDLFELKSCIESLVDEFHKIYSNKDILEFINTLEIYCLMECYEEEVYNFNVYDYTLECIARVQ
jgi:methyl coenzyme M reductase subunit C-like uncharacterized protein (methanogenesis marker protein 7)